jgi:hypothetical protein
MDQNDQKLEVIRKLLAKAERAATAMRRTPTTPRSLS